MESIYCLNSVYDTIMDSHSVHRNTEICVSKIGREMLAAVGMCPDEAGAFKSRLPGMVQRETIQVPCPIECKIWVLSNAIIRRKINTQHVRFSRCSISVRTTHQS